MDGYAVCTKLKEDPTLAKIPVIFVTAMSEIDDEAKGFDVGAVDYVLKPICAPILLRRINTHLSLIRAQELAASHKAAIYMLGEAGHYNDTDTGVHIWRMAAYARVLAKAAGWSDEKQNLIEMAAPLHDTGKIGTPDSILKAERKLTAEEWVVMRQHSQIGAGILSKSDCPLFRIASEIALYHHERWDGTGYPEGLSGDAIPESARIVAVADVFDALTMRRPYKEAWPVDRAIAEIKNGSGSHFDPIFVDLFEKNLTEILEVKEEWENGIRKVVSR